MSDEPAPTWAIVELMGHVRLAGRLSEEEKFGTKLGRLDIPDGDGFVTQFFGGGSVYRITPCSEAVARDAAKRCIGAPIGVFDYPQLPGRRTDDDYYHDDDSGLEDQ